MEVQGSEAIMVLLEAGKKPPTSLMQLFFLVFHDAVQPYNKVMVDVG